MYQVIGADGQIYGPVNVETLGQWYSDGKIHPQSTVIDPITGQSGPASVILKYEGIFPEACPPTLVQPTAMTAGSTSQQVIAPANEGTLIDADLGARFVGQLIDGSISIPLCVLAAVPFVGLLMAPAACFYWLARDSFFAGQSVGKKIAGTRVVRLDGKPITWGQSALRNASALGILVMAIPVIGDAMAIWVVGVPTILEVVCVVFTKRRIGDHLAGTRVVKA